LQSACARYPSCPKHETPRARLPIKLLDVEPRTIKSLVRRHG
jgi:hypothetical protein